MSNELTPRLSGGALALPAVAITAAATAVIAAVAFDQGLLASALTDAMRDSGGVLHELFHDARHLLGVPCH